MARIATLPRPLLVYAAIALINYAAQIPYALDLYGLRVNLSGVALLGATLAWLLVALGAAVRGRRVGFALLTAYAATQVAFYLRNLVLQIGAGLGFLYNLAHARDGIVFWVFVAGDVNFIAACVALAYLIARWRHLVAPRAGAGSGRGVSTGLR